MPIFINITITFKPFTSRVWRFLGANFGLSYQNCQGSEIHTLFESNKLTSYSATGSGFGVRGLRLYPSQRSPTWAPYFTGPPSSSSPPGDAQGSRQVLALQEPQLQSPQLGNPQASNAGAVRPAHPLPWKDAFLLLSWPTAPGDTGSVFQGCVLYWHPLEDSPEQSWHTSWRCVMEKCLPAAIWKNCSLKQNNLSSLPL